MFPELILSGGLAVTGGLAGYLYLEHLRSKTTQAEETKTRRASFRDALMRELRMTQRGQFDFEEFATSCDLPIDEANRVAEEIYSGLSQKVVADGVITPEEREKLDGLADALLINADHARSIEQGAKGKVYRDAVSEALSDGILTSSEAAELKSLRRSLGIGRTEGLGMIENISRDAYLAMLRRIVQAGELDTDSKVELTRFKKALALTDEDAARMIQKQAFTLYREAFTSVVQDGIVTPQEESFLRWLQGEAGLNEDAVLPFHARLAEVKRLAEYRAGRPPSIQTRKLLEGGEICHWDATCQYSYQTRTKQLQADGELLVSSKRVLFNSPTKNISFAPWKIIDIVLHQNALEIKVDAQQGNGFYFVSRTEELEAILVGLARKGKFLVTESYDSAITRHIPGEVKREVWARDGGRCAQCGAENYLEFDHIIPHAKGGANTVKNVQLLCRGCNNLKSDRI